VTLPEHIGYAEGACFGIPALTALQAVRLAELRPASTVMIVGGAGSVAHYAIQFAKMRGARVITTVSGPEKATHARKAGADEMINYRTENLGQRVKALSNRLIHTVGRRLPLNDIALAHELSERGAILGNIVLDIR
jgi:NADPH2:quinone reductase